jgi:hypothetical protein
MSRADVPLTVHDTAVAGKTSGHHGQSITQCLSRRAFLRRTGLAIAGFYYAEPAHAAPPALKALVEWAKVQANS